MGSVVDFDGSSYESPLTAENAEGAQRIAETSVTFCASALSGFCLPSFMGSLKPLITNDFNLHTPRLNKPSAKRINLIMKRCREQIALQSTVVRSTGGNRRIRNRRKITKQTKKSTIFSYFSSIFVCFYSLF
jgi:hypothetical protein